MVVVDELLYAYASSAELVFPKRLKKKTSRKDERRRAGKRDATTGDEKLFFFREQSERIHRHKPRERKKKNVGIHNNEI